MKRQKLVKMASAVVLTLGVIALTGRLSTPLSVQAQEAQDNHQGNHKDDGEASLVRIGFEIAARPAELGGERPLEGGLRQLSGERGWRLQRLPHRGRAPKLQLRCRRKPLFWPADKNRRDHLPGRRYGLRSRRPASTRGISATSLLASLGTIRWARYHYAQPDTEQNGTSGRWPHA
jgi:hypothetical protein